MAKILSAEVQTFIKDTATTAIQISIARPRSGFKRFERAIMFFSVWALADAKLNGMRVLLKNNGAYRANTIYVETGNGNWVELEGTESDTELDSLARGTAQSKDVVDPIATMISSIFNNVFGAAQAATLKN